MSRSTIRRTSPSPAARGKTFGSWTGGAITIGNGNLTFAGGNTALGDDISVDGGKGTVINKGPLQIATLAPLTITGNFTQTAAGALGLDFAGDFPGQYGALAISGSASLDGGLGIDLTERLHAGERRQLRHPHFRQPQGTWLRRAFARRRGLHDEAHGFVGLRRRRASDRRYRRDVARPPRGARLRRIRTSGSVAHPRTLDLGDDALGFLGLGGLGLRKRGRAAAS